MLILVDDHLFPGHSFASHQRTNQSERAREMAAASIRYRHSSGGGSHGRRLLWLLLACSWVAAASGQQQTARTDPAEGTYIYVQQLSIGSLPYVSVIPYVSCMHTISYRNHINLQHKFHVQVCNPTCMCFTSFFGRKIFISAQSICYM